jgi:hypothetical protein
MKISRFIVIAALAVFTAWSIHFATNQFLRFGSIQGHTTPAPEGASALVRSLRPNYPFSVIAGGAYSRDELNYASAHDPVVHAHYSGFELAHAQLVRLTDDRYQYVSYRTKDKVFWTRKKLRIPKGELLLTDGRNYARARCGNRLSDKPHAATTSAMEPSATALSLPSMRPDILPKLALAAPPALEDGQSQPSNQARTAPILPGNDTLNLPGALPPSVPFSPVFGPPGIGSPTGGSPGGSGPTKGEPHPTTPPQPLPTEPVDVAPVPEPGSIGLFVISLLLSSWVLVRMELRNDRESEKHKE